MSFLEEYRALERTASGADLVKRQAAMLQEGVVKRQQEMFADLRAHEPIFVTPAATVVTRYRDVIEVLDLDETFGVAPYGVAMMRNNGGPNFILGMDSGPEFEHDLATLKMAIRRDDLDRIRTIVATRTRQVIDGALASGRLDLAETFGRLIPTLLVGDYFGVPGPTPAVLMDWVRAIFTDIFLNFAQEPSVSKRGADAGVQFRAYVDALIAGLKAGQTSGVPLKDDVAGRLIAMQAGNVGFTDTRLRDNLIGCVTGVLENTNTAVANIIDVLFERPDVLKQAQAAALAGDTAKVRRFVLEAMRFRTPAGLGVRLTLHEHTLAKGTPGAKTIPAHTIVFAATASAMMDETVIDSPLEFRLDRPSHNYLHFGWGMHQCLGKYISEVQVTEIISALLKLKNLRRAAGPEGTLTYQGPFPKQFVVEFESDAVSV